MRQFGNGNNYLGSSVFSPYNNMDDLQQRLQQQLQQVQQVQQQAKQPSQALQELQEQLGQLNEDERHALFISPEFAQAKQIYEAGFIDFLGGKYSMEYVSTPIGKEAAENLNRIAQEQVKSIKSKVKEKQDKLEAFASLLESDPEIQKILQEKLAKKS